MGTKRKVTDHFWFLSVALGLSVLLATQGAAELSAKRPPLAQVLTTVHRAHLREIQLGQLAKEKGTSSEIRAYGDRLLRDHRVADGMLVDIADEMKVTLGTLEPIAPHEKQEAASHAAVMADLSQAPSDQFDADFLRVIKSKNEEALQTLTDAVGNLPVSQVREHIVRMRPILGQHIELTSILLGKNG